MLADVSSTSGNNPSGSYAISNACSFFVCSPLSLLLIAFPVPSRRTPLFSRSAPAPSNEIVWPSFCCRIASDCGSTSAARVATLILRRRADGGFDNLRSFRSVARAVQTLAARMASAEARMASARGTCVVAGGREGASRCASRRDSSSKLTPLEGFARGFTHLA